MTSEFTTTPNTINDTPKFVEGQPVIVEARNRDEGGKYTSTERVPQAGWTVVKTETEGENVGKVLVKKIDGNFVYDRHVSPGVLDALQKKYDTIRTGEGVSVIERRQVGHASLDAAEVLDPSQPVPWSEAWSKERKAQERSMQSEDVLDATAEKPYYFPTPRKGEYAATGSAVDVLGFYNSPGGNMLIVSDPLDPGFDHVLVSDITLKPERPVQGEGVAELEAELSEVLAGIQLGPNDLNELGSYTVAQQMGSDVITNRNLARMSSDAVRAIADRYAAVYAKIIRSNR